MNRIATTAMPPRRFRPIALATTMCAALGLIAGCSDQPTGQISIKGDKTSVIEPKFDNAPPPAPEKQQKGPAMKSIKDRGKNRME